jgi:hypothetical protein
MAHSTPEALSHQLASFRRSLAQTSGLPFADLLSEQQLRDAFVNADAPQPVYTPLVTVWMFLSQVLDPDPSCTQAVARLLAWQAATAQPLAGAATGAYCKARQRLDEADLHRLVGQTGQRLHQQARRDWLWLGRPVKIIDGTTVTMPDTTANQATYPQPDGQQPGLGFPMARLGVLLSLATGAVLDAALAAYRGKGTGELSLLRQLWHHLQPGDVLLGDRLYCSYFEIALLAGRGVEVVLHRHQSRRSDFRTGRRLGCLDHEVTWRKPARPAWLEPAIYEALPATLTLREVAVTIRGPRGQRRRLVLVTTLRDPQAVPKAALADVYRQRWHGEVDVRSLKQVLQMDVLRCKTPAMVRKEIWVHLLGYNLIRGLMAASAQHKGLDVRALSFKGALQTLNAFRYGLLTGAITATGEFYGQLLEAIGSHRVNERPGRVEPRAKKRRRKNYPLLTVPRAKARQRLLGQGT